MPKNLLKKTFNFFQKIFDKTIRSCYHIQVSGKQTEQNSIRPDGQAVKTTPSHGVNPGSIPGQVMKLYGIPYSFFFISIIVFINTRKPQRWQPLGFLRRMRKVHHIS